MSEMSASFPGTFRKPLKFFNFSPDENLKWLLYFGRFEYKHPTFPFSTQHLTILHNEIAINCVSYPVA